MSLSTFLNGRAPTTLRGLQMLALSESGVLFAGSAVSDSGGGASTSWVASGTFPCRIDALGDRGASQVIAGRIDERSTHVVTMVAGVAVSTDSRVSISGRGTFEVTAVRNYTGEPVRTFEVLQLS